MPPPHDVGVAGCPLVPVISVLAMKLLLIDDDAELVAVLTLALDRAGFAV